MSKFNRYLTSILLLLSGAGFSQSAIAVMDFEPSGIPAHEASLLSDRLRNELVRLGVYRVVEREMMTEILDEQGFQQSGCTSSECLVEAGRLIGVRRIIGGRIGNIGSVYMVSARLIDVETGELIRVTDYDTNQGGRQILSGGMAEVAKVLSGVTEESEPNRIGKLARLKSAALTMKKSIRSFSLDDRLIISSGIPLGRGGITYQIGYVILLDNPTWTTLWSYPVLGYSYSALNFYKNADSFNEIHHGPQVLLLHLFQLENATMFSQLGIGNVYYDSWSYVNGYSIVDDSLLPQHGVHLNFSGKIGLQTQLVGIPIQGSLQCIQFPYFDKWQWYVTAGIRF